EEEDVYLPNRRNANLSSVLLSAEEYQAGTSCATQTHQQVPVSFQPAPIKMDVYPLPKLITRPRAATHTANQAAQEVTVQLTTSWAMLEKIAKLHQQTENSTKTGHTSAAGETSEAPPRKAMAAEVKQQPEQLEQPMQPVSMSTPTGLPYCVTGEHQAGKRGIQ
ncbi:hypothetical protein Vretimale_7268, partial [Volvox reticuliferus]